MSRADPDATFRVILWGEVLVEDLDSYAAAQDWIDDNLRGDGWKMAQIEEQ